MNAAVGRRHLALARARGARASEGPRRSTRRRWPRCARCSATRRGARDLLIEHLHRIQDRYGCLSAAHLVALAAGDEARDGRGLRGRDRSTTTSTSSRTARRAPPPITVRVCETLSCADGRRRRAARDAASGARRRTCACSRAPCIGRCEHGAGRGRRPATRSTHATRRGGRRSASRASGDRAPTSPPYVDYAAYRAGGGYAHAARLRRRQARRRRS